MDPGERQGTIGRVLDFVTAGDSLESTSARFEELRAAEVAPFQRDLSVMKICVGIAPLLGLFGTVTGMLTTFSALASGAGGEKTMAMVAKGISEALVTTETGLVIALPGLFMHHLLARHHERYSAFLTHLETVCNQKLHLRPAEQAGRYVPARKVGELVAEGEYVGVTAATSGEELLLQEAAAQG